MLCSCFQSVRAAYLHCLVQSTSDVSSSRAAGAGTVADVVILIDVCDPLGFWGTSFLYMSLYLFGSELGAFTYNNLSRKV